MRDDPLAAVRFAMMGCKRAPFIDLLSGTPGGGYGLERYFHYAKRLRDELPDAKLRAAADELLHFPWRRL